jgi:hypothetical protein
MPRRRTGIALATPDRYNGEVFMYALAAVLVGVVGIFYVRRRSARKKQDA